MVQDEGRTVSPVHVSMAGSWTEIIQGKHNFLTSCS